MTALPPIPDVAAGTVLDFPANDWRYGTGDLRLRVGKVRAELARHYGGAWVWIDDERLDDDGKPFGRRQFLVRTEALVRAVAAVEKTAGRRQAATGQDRSRDDS